MPIRPPGEEEEGSLVGGADQRLWCANQVRPAWIQIGQLQKDGDQDQMTGAT